MNWTKLKLTTKRCVWQPLLITMLAVCLTGCVEDLASLKTGSLKSWTNQMSAAIPATVETSPIPPANIPDLPPDIRKCLERPACTKSSKKPKTADEAALACAQSDEERRACATKVVRYWEQVKKANKAKGDKPAKIAPFKPLSP